MTRRTAFLAGLLVPALALALPAWGARRQAVRGPGYTTYQQAAFATQAGEPSIGVSWRTGAVFLQAGLETDRVLFGGTGRAVWSSVGPLETSLVSLDPIGFTDGATGRVFVSQLTAVGSVLAYSDNDGATWTPSQGSGLPAGADHQTLGGGPYPAEATARPLTAYPHAVYYCSQDVVTAFCARSDTGGLTFGPGVPIYSLADCFGIHGHVKVAPDGTVYVPNSDCNGSQAVAVSTDAGLTWTVRRIPGSTPGTGDPSVATGRDGTVYVALTDAHGLVKVAVSRNRGVTWSPLKDVGAPFGVRSAVFPAAVAGDGDRAAVAFLGTTTAGDPQNPAFGEDASGRHYTGAAYHLYVATTYDRGATWRTVDVTPRDPVQRGRVCLAGTTCTGADRNLLDFIDVQVDRQGRVLVGWADGCTGACVRSTLVKDNAHTALGTITRQTSGVGLYRTPPALAR